MKAKPFALLGGLAVVLGIVLVARTQSSRKSPSEPRLVSMALVQSWTPKPSPKPNPIPPSDQDGFPDIADTHWASETRLTDFQQLRIFYALGNISQYRNIQIKEENPSANFQIGYEDPNEHPTVTRYQTIPFSALPPNVKQTVLNILKESNFKPLGD